MLELPLHLVRRHCQSISLAIGYLTLRGAAVVKSKLNCIYFNPLILSHKLNLT
jgi:hypothetical protein